MEFIDVDLMLPRAFLPNSVDSYTSSSLIRNHKISSNKFRNKMDFFEKSVVKIRYNNPNLLSLDIHCQNIGDTSHLMEALAINSTLLELSIRYQQLDELVASQLVDALSDNSTLTRLSLKENHLDDAAATRLSDLLRFNSTLLSLDLSRTRITENGIARLSAALSVNTSLTHLDLRWNNLMRARATLLSEALTLNTVLTVLDLRWCNLCQAGGVQLSEAMAVNSSITRLELDDRSPIFSSSKESIIQRLFDNRFLRIHLPHLLQNDPLLTTLMAVYPSLKDTGAKRLGEALAMNSTLTELHLFESGIGWLGMTSICQSLVANTSLTLLNLSLNKFDDDDLAHLDCVLTKHTMEPLNPLMINLPITLLYLDSCQIGDHGVARLCDTLKMNASLISLSLRENKITDIGANSIVTALEINSTLKKLCVDGNQISVEGMKSLQNALISNQTLTYLRLEDNSQVLMGIYAVSLEDHWIVRKNQSLYQLLSQFCEIYFSFDTK